MPSTRSKLRLCNNKSALEQRAEEDELSLAHLRQFSKRQSRQYHDPSSMVVGDGLELADALDIAEKINHLAASLRDIGASDSDIDVGALQRSLQKATKTIQSIHEKGSGLLDGPTKEVTFYDGKVLPKSPLKSSNGHTPRRSNVTAVSEMAMGCSSPQRLLHTASTAAMSCASGYLATIGEISPPPSPRLVELSDDDDCKPSSGRKKGKRISLDFSGFPSNGDGKKNIRIKKGDVAIKIWGPSVGGLTLTTGGPSSSGENDSPAESPASWEINRDSTHNSAKSKSTGGRRATTKPKARSQTPQKRIVFPWQKKADDSPARHEQAGGTISDATVGSQVSGTNLENLVLGAMKPQHTLSSPPPILRARKDKLHHRWPIDDEKQAASQELLAAMSNLSYVSGLLPNDNFGDKKFQTVKTDDEKGFEVYLEGTSTSSSRYSSSKLRQRAAINEKLLSKRREIISIQQDLEACSLMLGKCNQTKTLKKEALPVIKEQKTDDRHATGEESHRAIIRE